LITLDFLPDPKNHLKSSKYLRLWRCKAVCLITSSPYR
jgi:hypothetical protein